MDSISAYRKILVEVIDFAFGFGTKSVGIEQFRKGPPDTWEKSIKDKFYISCHEGFKKAQLSLLKEISKYQNLQRETTKQLKEFRRQRDKKGSRESEEQLGIINQRLHTFSHIADGIAWQLIGGQIHIARRFHIGQHSKIGRAHV